MSDEISYEFLRPPLDGHKHNGRLCSGWPECPRINQKLEEERKKRLRKAGIKGADDLSSEELLRIFRKK